jgi:hypothetical protein
MDMESLEADLSNIGSVEGIGRLWRCVVEHIVF